MSRPRPRSDRRKVATPDSSRCRWCGNGVLWLRHEVKGKLAPIDPHPVPGGNILVNRKDESYSVVAKAELGLFDATVFNGPDATPTLHMNHWATCTSATARRLAKARQAGHTGPLVTADGDLVHPHDRNADGVAQLDPLSAPADVQARLNPPRCSVCGERLDPRLAAAGILTHPSC